MKFKFLREFIQNPNITGAILPSSYFLAKKMLEPLLNENNIRVVEFGPGTGSMTSLLVDLIEKKGGTYLGIEKNPEFFQEIQNLFPDSHFVLRGAEELPEILGELNLKTVNAVVSGLPWALFPSDFQNQILKATAQSLVEGGFFTTFAYLHSSYMPGATRFKKNLNAHFPRVEKTTVVWKNIPPAFVYRAWK